jgi:hypothetical protein
MDALTKPAAYNMSRHVVVLAFGVGYRIRVMFTGVEISWPKLAAIGRLG